MGDCADRSLLSGSILKCNAIGKGAALVHVARTRGALASTSLRSAGHANVGRTKDLRGAPYQALVARKKWAAAFGNVSLFS